MTPTRTRHTNEAPPSNTCALTKTQRKPITAYSPYLGKTVFEIAPAPNNNRTDAISYRIVRLIVDPRIEVAVDNLGECKIRESLLCVMLVTESAIGAQKLRDAAKFKAGLCSREKALSRLNKLIIRAEAIENDSLLERWQGFKQQIEQGGADALFC